MSDADEDTLTPHRSPDLGIRRLPVSHATLRIPMITLVSTRDERKAPRLLRALARLFVALFLTAFFFSAAMLGALLHLDTPPARRLVRHTVEDALDGALRGSVRIQTIHHLGPHSLTIEGARIYDPNGRKILWISGLSARYNAIELAREILLGRGPIDLAIESISVDHLELFTARDASGDFGLLQAFEPTSTEAAPEGRPLALTLNQLTIESAWAHGPLSESIALDASIHDLQSRFELFPDGNVAIELSPTSIVERSLLPAKLRGHLDGRLRTRDDGVEAESTWSGRIGEVALDARASISGDYVQIHAKAPRVTPEELSSLIEEPPLTLPVTIELKASGELPILKLRGRLSEIDAPSREIRITGTARLSPIVTFDLEAEARGINPQLFAKEAPSVSVSARARATIALEEEGPRVRARARTEPFELDGQPVPAIEARASYDKGKLSASTRIYEEGMKLEADFDLENDKTLRFDIKGTIPELQKAPRLMSPVGGRARFRLEGVYDQGRIDTRVKASFAITSGDTPLQIRRGELAAHARGPLDALRVALSLEADDRLITARAKLDLEDKSARDLRVDLRRGEESARIRASSVRFAPSGARVRGLSIRGDTLGSLEGSIALGPKTLSGELRAESFDIGRALALVDLGIPVDGITSFDIALHPSRRGPEGHIALMLEEGRYAELHGLSANLTINIRAGDLSLAGYLRVVAEPSPGEPDEPACNGTVAKLQISRATLSPQGPFAKLRSWSNATGSAELFTESQDLRCLVKRTPITLPEDISDIAGAIMAKLTLRRDRGERLPTVTELSMKTKGLAVQGALDPLTNAPDWTSESLDIAARMSFDGESGDTRGELYVYDRAIFADLAFAVTLDPEALLGDPDRLLSTLERAPAAAHLSLPRRPLKDYRSLPAFIAIMLPSLAGQAKLDAYFTGSAREPNVALRVTGFGIGEPSAEAQESTIDLDAFAVYDGEDATLRAFASYEGKRLATAEAKASLPIDAVFRKGAEIPWSASANAELDGLSLGKLPYLAEREVAGTLVGNISIQGINQTPTIKVDLRAPGLKLGREVFFEEAHVKLDLGPADDGRSTAALHADFLTYDGGHLRVHADAGIMLRGATPDLDPTRRAGFMIDAHRFRLSAAAPFVREAVSQLDGYLDGQIEFDIPRLYEPEKATVVGELRVTHGFVVLPSIGQRLTDTRFSLRASPNGLIYLENFKAESIDGELLGAASARFQGLLPVSAALVVTIPRQNDIAISLEGTPIGEVSGTIQAQLINESTAIVARVKLSDFRLELPPSIGKSVQSLEPHEDIIIHPPLEPPEEEEIVEPARKSVRVTATISVARIHGKGLEAAVQTDPKAPLKIELDEKPRVDGDIRVLDAKLELLGKVFQIERGLIHMRPDAEPSNPYVNVSGFWDAPDGTRVFIAYIGDLEPISASKLKLSSEPPRTEQQIMSLILLGPDYAEGTVAGGPGTEAAGSFSGAAGDVAVGLGRSLISEQLNAILNSIAPLRRFEVKLSATERGALRAQVGYQISERLTARASYVAGSTMGPGVPGGTATQSGRGTELSLEWRVYRNFSLRGSVGVGVVPSTSFDLLWTKRY